MRIKKCKSLIFQEPSLNLIQLVENFDDEMINSGILKGLENSPCKFGVI